MNVLDDDRLAWAHGWTLPELGMLALGTAALVVGSVLARRAVRRAGELLASAREGVLDPRTGLMHQRSLAAQLDAELGRAMAEGRSLAVVVLRARGSRLRDAAAVVADAMRIDEQGFLLDGERIAIGLWNADEAAAEHAIARIAARLEEQGHAIVDVGLALAPEDGDDPEALVRLATRRSWPADQRPVHAPRHRLGDLVGGVAAWLLAATALLLAANRVLPATHGSAGTITAAVIASVGFAAAAGLLHVAAWNLGAGPAAPRSHPLRPAGWRGGLTCGACVGVPLLAAAAASGRDELRLTSLGLGVVGLIVLAMLQARHAVRLPAILLLAAVAAGAAVTWLAVDADPGRPIIADGGRLLVATCVGGLLARLVERVSWLVALAVLTAAIDTWSVLSSDGVTRRLVDGEGSGLVARLLTYTGPPVDGRLVLGVGVTDLVFLALFLGFAHVWRRHVPSLALALGLALAGALVVASVVEADVPALPFLSLAFVLHVAATDRPWPIARWLRLQPAGPRRPRLRIRRRASRSTGSAAMIDGNPPCKPRRDPGAAHEH